MFAQALKFDNREIFAILMLTFMDEFRTPRRLVHREGTLYDVPTRAGVTQTPIQIPSSPAPVATPIQSMPTPTVNPSLRSGFSSMEGLAAAPSIPSRAMPSMRPQQTKPLAQPHTQTALAPLSPLQNMARDFSMPRPQTIVQEAAVVTESAAAAQAIESAEAPAPPVAAAFDLAAIQEETKPKNRLRNHRLWRKWAVSGGVAALCLVMGTGGLLFAQGYNNAHKVFRGAGATASASGAEKTVLKGEDKGRVNILLLGNGGMGHDAPDLTDTMIVASIDTVNKTATMLSIPRDLWVKTPNSGSTKINATYEIGKYNKAGKIDNTNDNTEAVMAGFASADQAVEAVTGLKIDYNLLVNFTSFKQAVDAVGGVNVNVPEVLYDPTMAWENGNNPVLANAGPQQMDGKKALSYVRSRATSSDFARSERQRSVILALKSKILTAGTLSNPLKVSGLANAFGSNLLIDMTLSEGMRAYEITKGIDNSKIKTIDLVTAPNNLVTTGSVQNSSIALPKAGLYQYADIQKYIQQVLNPPQATKTTTKSPVATTTAPVAPETAQIAVLNGTPMAGLAGTRAATLKAAGYNVITVSNAPTKTYTSTVVVDLSKGANPTTKKYLEAQYGVTAVTQLPDGAIQAGPASFVVILGSDQAR